MAQPVKAKKSNESIFTGGFSTYSVDDLSAAKQFYDETLGLDIKEKEEGLSIDIPDGPGLFLYPKDDHSPATFTVLNLLVAYAEKAVDELSDRGIEFLQYDDPSIETDEKGIHWGAKAGEGPNIAWFNDPAGNIISIIEE